MIQTVARMVVSDFSMSMMWKQKPCDTSKMMMMMMMMMLLLYENAWKGS